MNEPSTTFVVWTQDFEFTLSPSGSQAGKEEEMKVKVRCAECWGGLVLRGERENGVVSGIKCLVCKNYLSGKAADVEYRRVLEEAVGNDWRASMGGLPAHERGPFVCKQFPHLPRCSEDEVRERILAKVELGDQSEWLTRRDFPFGEAAYLYVQARLLVAAVSDMYATHDEAVVGFRKAPTKDDLGDDERDLLRRLGSTMARGMMSAFACELVMKAISLTIGDEAKREHDLLLLYRDLPEPSRQRLEFDFPGIAEAMEEGRQRFGRWRYFERGKKEALKVIIDTSLEQSLGKAARVLLDEAEIVGLRGGVDLKARRDVTDHGDKKEAHYRFNATLKGAENPPRLT